MDIIIMEKHLVKLDSRVTSLKDYMVMTFDFSSRRVKLLLKDRKVFINGKVAYWDSKLHDGDLLSLDLSEKCNPEISPEELPIDIIYEDEHILAVNKPPFMLVHPTPNHQTGTLANALKYYFGQTRQNISIRFLNRLDMNTSGVVVVPKSSVVHKELNEMMEKGMFAKIYKAVAEGNVSPDSGTIEKPISKDPENPIKRAVIDGGQYTITKYKVLKHLRNASLLELNLITGRTHQIRVHLSHIGHPIIGDSLYGDTSSFINRQALHATSMQLVHPTKKEKLILNAPLPEDMNKLIDKLSR